MLESFVQLKNEMNQDITAIYDEIGHELCQENSTNLVASLIQKETLKVNIYISELMNKTKKVAIEALKEQGYPEYLTSGAWNKILKEIGVPKFQMCSVQKFQENTDSGREEQKPFKGTSVKYAEQMKTLETTRNVGIGAGMVGGTAISAALIIPGWEALPMIMLCAGGAILVCGSVSAIKAQSQIETLKKKLEEEQSQAQKAPNRVTEKNLVMQMVSLQAKRNTESVGKWIDRIEQAVVQVAASATV